MAAQILVAESQYSGKYVALASFANNSVVASGKDPMKVMKAAQKLGCASPVITFVPKKSEVFVY